jgi:hypothetical protein
VISKKNTLLGSDNFCRSPLFGSASLDQSIGGHTFVMTANVAIGYDHVENIAPLFHPSSGRTSHRELDIVGMGIDQHSSLWYVGVVHYQRYLF